MLPFWQQAFAFRLAAGKGAYFYSLFSYVTALYLVCSRSFLFCFFPVFSLFLLFF